MRDRIDSHAQTKEFWEQGYAFTTSNNGLNKAHVRWLERELIQQAKTAGRSKLDNGTAPPEPPLSEAERADSRAFLREILQALPIMGLRAFEVPKPVATPACAGGDPPRALPPAAASRPTGRCRGGGAGPGGRVQGGVPGRAPLARHPHRRREAAADTLRGGLPDQAGVRRDALRPGGRRSSPTARAASTS